MAMGASVKTTYELSGWGDSRSNPGRRGGFWSHYIFHTLAEAEAEQKQQYADQKWRKKQRARAEERLGRESAMSRWGDDFDREFPIIKVTSTQLPIPPRFKKG